MDRCAIFSYFDKEGHVDEYVIYLLEQLKPFVTNLLAVCNGTLTEEGAEKLERVADKILFRENAGLDAGGYGEGIFYYGFQKLQKYDEILLLDHTFFGPFYPFSEMFDAMEQRELDFWGITRHHKTDVDSSVNSRYGYLPEYIQTYFLVLRKSLFMSNDYQEFIFNLKNLDSDTAAIYEYEAIFTKYFEDLGYTWDTYVDTREYEGFSYTPVLYYIKDIIEKQRCPIIMRKTFYMYYQEYMSYTSGTASIEAYEYICEHCDYNTDMIWDNILRLENLTDVFRVMHFNYVIPTYTAYYEKWQQKTAVCILIESTKHGKLYLKYFQAIPDETDVYLLGNREDCLELQKEYFANREQLKIVETEADYGTQVRCALQLSRNQYEYICIANMRDIEQIHPYSNGVSWQYSDWENILGSLDMVRNIIETFEANKRLGMLIPPLPGYGELFAAMADGWMGSFESVANSLKRAGISVNLRKDAEPIAPVGGSFWLKVNKNILDTIVEIKEEMKILCLELPFLVQAAGYYTGMLYNDHYAAIEITNQDYMMRETNRTVFEIYGLGSHSEMPDRIRMGKIILKKSIPETCCLFVKKLYFKIRKRLIHRE